MESAAPENPALRRAVGYILLASIAFASMWGLIRLASHEMHAFQVVAGRNFFGLMCMLPWLVKTRADFVHGGEAGRHLRRATSGFVATFGTFYAIAHAPLATVMSISYTTPLFATLGAVLLLGERIRIRRIAALVVGFFGILLVLRPGTLPLTSGIGAAMIAAMATAVSVLAIKKLTATESHGAIVFWSFALMLPPSLLVAAPFWHWPSAAGWLLLALIGLGAFLGQITMVRAYELAEASALMPYDFLRFGLVIAIGVLGFGERFDAFSLLGGSLILVSTIYLAHRERILGRDRITKPQA